MQRKFLIALASFGTASFLASTIPSSSAPGGSGGTTSSPVPGYMEYSPHTPMTYSVGSTMQTVTSGALFQHTMTISDSDTLMNTSEPFDTISYNNLNTWAVLTLESGTLHAAESGGQPVPNPSIQVLTANTNKFTYTIRALTVTERTEKTDILKAVDNGGLPPPNANTIHDNDGNPISVTVIINPS